MHGRGHEATLWPALAQPLPRSAPAAMGEGVSVTRHHTASWPCSPKVGTAASAGLGGLGGDSPRWVRWSGAAVSPKGGAAVSSKGGAAVSSKGGAAVSPKGGAAVSSKGGAAGAAVTEAALAELGAKTRTRADYDEWACGTRRGRAGCVGGRC